VTLARVLLLSLLPIAVIVGHVVVVVLDVELWPFSPYPMYSEIRSEWRGETVQVVGLKKGGGEITLNQNGYFGPYSNLWVMNLVEELERRGQPKDPALSALLDVYDDRRAEQRHDGPALVGFRVERVFYELDRDKRAAPPISERKVVATFTRGAK
jgi:hypothetical protein